LFFGTTRVSENVKGTPALHSDLCHVWRFKRGLIDSQQKAAVENHSRRLLAKISAFVRYAMPSD
jgi:hypothetical protein